jgi:hypothetical protein
MSWRHIFSGEQLARGFEPQPEWLEQSKTTT